MRRRPPLVALLLASLLFNLTSAASQTAGPAGAPKEPLAGWDDFVNRALADWKVPGLAMAIVVLGRGIDLSLIAALAIPPGLVLQMVQDGRADDQVGNPRPVARRHRVDANQSEALLPVGSRAQIITKDRQQLRTDVRGYDLGAGETLR